MIWQGIGAGFTANPWQSMVAKIIPPRYQGTFIGSQASAGNFMSSISAIVAGIILERFEYPGNFALCFGINIVAMVISYIFLAQTREEEKPLVSEILTRKDFWNNLGRIIKQENQFRWFLVVRMVSQFAVMSFAFYTVYAVHELGMSELGVGLMTSVYMGSQIIANPIMGFFGDRYNHRFVMQIGMVAAIASSLIAYFTATPVWFYLVFLMAGIANIAVWNTVLAMTIEFGEDHEKPYYIGLANTIVAPFAMLAPIFGGWIADNFGYTSTFMAAAFCGVITIVTLLILQKQKSMTKEIVDVN